MTVVIVGMLVALLIAGVVVALVAIPARREGREVLSREGEQLVQAAFDKTVDVVGVARDKVGDLADRLPVPNRADEQPAAVDGPQTIDLREQQPQLPQQTGVAPQHRAS
jgi:hypothetical protein